MWLSALYTRVPGKLGGIGHGLQLLSLLVMRQDCTGAQNVKCVDKERVCVPRSPACALQGCDDPCVAHMTALDMESGSKHYLESYNNTYYLLLFWDCPGNAFMRTNNFQ